MRPAVVTIKSAQSDLIKKVSEVSKNLLPRQSRAVAIIMYLNQLARQAIEQARALMERIRRFEKSQEMVEIAGHRLRHVPPE